MTSRLLLFLLITGIISGVQVQAQNFEKVWMNKNDSLFGYYSVVKPLSGRVQGVLAIMDGFGGNATGYMTESKIHNVACANDILTVCIPITMRQYIDSSMISMLNTVFRDLQKTYTLRKDQFALAGFAQGGTIALRYAELCKEKPADFPVQPKAVFTAETPVDVAGLYYSCKRDLKKQVAGAWWMGEAQWLKGSFEQDLGDPGVSLLKYRMVSPFLNIDTIPGNERFLKDVAYRAYYDTDVAWFLQNRKRSLYETNMLNGSELVNRLILLGNNQAEFIASKTPARRSNGIRHPVSWSVVDEADVIQWIKDKLNFFPDHLAQPFNYKVPEGWSTETILFPMDFAPAITYKGFEELRFAPGWGDAASSQRWAYTLLWWLDGQYQFNEAVLTKDLEAYYSGLTQSRAVADKMDMSKWSPVKAQVKKVATAANDIGTYTASISIFDSQVTKKPGTLYGKIHIKNCPDAGRTFVIIEIAGLPVDGEIWKQLDKINDEFKCVK